MKRGTIDVEAAVRAGTSIESAAEAAAYETALKWSASDLRAVIALDPGAIVKWAAQKALHEKTGRWE